MKSSVGHRDPQSPSDLTIRQAGCSLRPQVWYLRNLEEQPKPFEMSHCTVIIVRNELVLHALVQLCFRLRFVQSHFPAKSFLYLFVKIGRHHVLWVIVIASRGKFRDKAPDVISLNWRHVGEKLFTGCINCFISDIALSPFGAVRTSKAPKPPRLVDKRRVVSEDAVHASVATNEPRRAITWSLSTVLSIAART